MATVSEQVEQLVAALGAAMVAAEVAGRDLETAPASLELVALRELVWNLVGELGDHRAAVRAAEKARRRAARDSYLALVR